MPAGGPAAPRCDAQPRPISVPLSISTRSIADAARRASWVVLGVDDLSGHHARERMAPLLESRAWRQSDFHPLVLTRSGGHRPDGLPRCAPPKVLVV